MRALLSMVLSTGCIAGTLDANSRPAVIPKLSEIPADSGKRDAILDQSQSTENPENQAPLSRSERKSVTAAAYAAALIGSMFSKTETVTLGVATAIDENQLFAPAPPPTPAPIEPAPAGELVPWVKLH